MTSKRFYSFFQDHIQDYIYVGHCDFDSNTLENLKNIFRSIIMLINLRKMIAMTTEVNPLVIPKLLSLVMILAEILCHPRIHFLNGQLTSLTTALALVDIVMPICHVFAMVMVSVLIANA